MLNKIMLIGNLGRDPNMTYTQDGTARTTFTLAVSRRFSKPGSDVKTEETEWFNIVAWRQLAETCNAYLHKGSKVYVEGRLTQRKYTDREGVQRLAVDVIISEMEMLTPKSADTQLVPAVTGERDPLDEFGAATNGDPLGDIDSHPF